MKNVSLKFFGLATMLLLSMTLVITSCGDDDDGAVSGCTDELAANHDANATSDDGSCTYFRDKFLADYDMQLDCMDQLAILSNDSLTIEIIPGSDPADPNGVTISFTSGVVQGLGFSGTTNGMTLTVPNQTKENLPLEGLILDVTGEGSFELDDSMNILTGVMSLVAENEDGTLMLTGDCNITATKQ